MQAPVHTSFQANAQTTALQLNGRSFVRARRTIVSRIEPVPSTTSAVPFIRKLSSFSLQSYFDYLLISFFSILIFFHKHRACTTRPTSTC